MKHTLLFLLLLVVMSLRVFAQETFRIGDMVETNDGRQCRIESITGSSARVRCGPNRSDIRVYSFQSLMSSKTAASKRESQQEQTQPHASSETTTSKSAQEAPGNFRVGDTVESPGGNQGTIESINGNSAKIKIGPGKYDFKYDLIENLKSPKAAALEREQEKQRASFRAEANNFFGTVQLFEQFYNPQFANMKGGIDAAVIKKATVDLAELDTLCPRNIRESLTTPNISTGSRSAPAIGAG